MSARRPGSSKPVRFRSLTSHALSRDVRAALRSCLIMSAAEEDRIVRALRRRLIAKAGAAVMSTEKRKQLERAFRALLESAPPDLREKLTDPRLTLDEKLEEFERVSSSESPRSRPRARTRKRCRSCGRK